MRRGTAPGLLREAARDVFAERGYRATTREIAERAGVSPDLLFRYFDSKERLFFDAVATPMLDAVDGLHQRWLLDPEFKTMDLEQVVSRFVTGFYGFMSENRSIARAMVHLFNEGSTEGGELELLRERISGTLQSMTAPVDAYLEAQGVPPSSPGLPLRIVLLLVGVVANFLPNTYAVDSEVPPQPAIIDELARFIYHGLRGT